MNNTSSWLSIWGHGSHLVNNIIMMCPCTQYKGPFFNYVDQIWPIIDHLPTLHRGSNSFTFFAKNLQTVDISSTTYLPRLVDVVKERPLTQPTLNPHEFFISELLGCLRGNQGCTMAF